ncbi:MAG TPA: Ig-like domain-containing protein [Longimicrobium sp.]
MNLFRKLRIVIPAAAAAALAACDGSGSAVGSTREVFIQIATPEVELAPGETAHLTATVSGGGSPEWRTSAPSVATIDASGNVTGLKDGEATVTAVYGKAASTATVRVKPRQIASVVVTPDAYILKAIGDSVQLSATAYDGTGKQVNAVPSFSTADSTVVSVTPAGLVRARGTGLARVVAAAGGKADTSMIQVVQLVTAVAISPAAVTLATGQTLNLSAVASDAGGSAVPGTSYTWASSNPAVATVDPSGVVHSVAEGSAMVTATAASGAAGQSQVSVQQTPIATLSISPSSFTLAPGQNAQASAIAKDANGTALTGRVVTWSSSNPTVANVSPLGVVFALADGSATITATAEGKTATAPVTVKTATSGGTPGTATVLASSDFENGSLLPYVYPYTQAPNDLSVATDPTGGGHGKVVKIHYAGTAADLNRSFGAEYVPGIGLGQSIFFRGDVYFAPPLAGSEQAARKLLYWQRDLSTGVPEFWAILTSFGYALKFSGGYVGTDGRAVEVMSPELGTLQPGRWYQVEMQITLNSAYTSSDGIVRIWVDGRLLYEKTDFRWSDPGWTYSPSAQRFRYFMVGDQVNYNGTFDEYRYWDNVSLSTGRLP